MINWLRRLLLTCTILGLLTANILTLTSTAFNAALSGFMSTALGVATVTEALQSKIAKQQAAEKSRKVAARKFGTRLATRTKRVAAASVAAIPAEAIPFLGVGVLVAGTAYELYEACESMRDLDEFYAGLGMADEVPGDVVREVCEVDLSYLQMGIESSPDAVVELTPHPAASQDIAGNQTDCTSFHLALRHPPVLLNCFL